MKKIFVLIIAMYCNMAAFAQCTPDNTITTPGLYPPDSLLPCIVSGVAYDTVIQFKNFTTINPNDLGIPTPIPITITVNSVAIDTILNVPTGISYNCNTPNCFYASGANGCLRVFGTTNAARGNYPLDLVVTLDLSIPFFGDTVITISTSQAAQNGFGGLFGYSLQVVNAGDPCPYPIVTISTPDTVSCANQPVQLNASNRFGVAPLTYSWSPATGLSATNIANPTATVSSDITYNVTVTDANSVTYTSSFLLEVTNLPEADFSFTANGNTVSFVNTTTGGLGAPIWNFGDGRTGRGNTISNTYNTGTATDYEITMIAQNDCGSDTVVKSITVTNIAEKYKNDFAVNVVPNPSNGNFNIQFDAAAIKGESVTLQLFNVQGKEVVVKNIKPSNASVNETIKTDDLSSGVYSLHISSSNLKSITKVVVQ
jgi:hypothetical protein